MLLVKETGSTAKQAHTAQSPAYLLMLVICFFLQTLTLRSLLRVGILYVTLHGNPVAINTFGANEMKIRVEGMSVPSYGATEVKTRVEGKVCALVNHSCDSYI